MSSTLNYVIAPPDWTYTAPNPFTPDGTSGKEWSAFCILDNDDEQFMTGQSGSGPFSARFGRRVPHLEHRLADFLRYENRHDRTVIVSFPPEMDVDRYVAQALSCTPDANVVRPYDVPVIVHSTTTAAWESIQADGEFKAASQITHRQNTSPNSNKPGQIEEYLRHEPPEYSDYIMFGEMESYGPEMVAASYQAGTFVMDANAVYQPGVRLYFDQHAIIRDGLGTRDGLHNLKVHLRLPLQPYLFAAIGVDDIDPHSEVTGWTIRAFTDKTDEAFRSRKAG